MKIKPEHYEQLVEMLKAAPNKPDRAAYAEQGLSEVRYRWDCLWAIDLKIRQEWFDQVYPYANDDHVNTALKKALVALGR